MTVTAPTTTTPTSTTPASTSTTTTTTGTGTAADISAGAANLSTSYSTFLTLLTTQLKNQDPTSPLDSNQFTQQLVQMTGVQQQLLSNQLLQQLVDSSGGGAGVTNAVGLIGKTVTASSPTAVLSGGAAAFGYNLPSAAASATLTVTDTSGAVVWTGSAPDLSAGTHGFTWNGKDQTGVQRVDGGAYMLSVTAADASGGALAATPLIQGTVTGVVTAAGVTNVKIGASSAPVSTVTSVTGS